MLHRCFILYFLGNLVRSKWKTLRDTFRKELKKMPMKRSGDGASETVWKSSWAHFESLYFLKDQFTARKSTGNLPEIGTDIVIEDTFETYAENLENNNIDDTSSASNEQQNTSQPNTSSASTPVIRGRKRKSENDDIGAALINLEKNKIRILEKETKNDEDELFFQSLLPHLRPLPPHQKMLLRIKIQELVYNFIYRNQNKNSHADTSMPVQPPSQYQIGQTNLTDLQNVSEYSNPTSVASYYSNFSEESQLNIL